MFRGRCVEKDQRDVISLRSTSLCLPHKQQDEANLFCLMPNSLNGSLFVDVKLHLSRKHIGGQFGPWAKRQKRNVNSAPQFQLPNYQVSVPENEPSGTRVITLKAFDADDGDAVRPDREVKSQYRIIVEANDQGREPGPRSATATVHIFIEDENDNYPQFSEKRYVVQVPENIAVNSQVAVVKATDRDAGNNAKVHYSIINGNIKGQFYFTINNKTGWITVGAELDRETTEFYSFGVEARDCGVPTMSSSASVSVTILDVNDNVPTFTQHLYNLKVNEDAAVGTSVLSVTAVDRDVNSVVTYQISSGNTRNRFAITSQSGGGLITLALPLDYKQERQYLLTITASDGTRHDTAQVFINVTDANTHRPVFQSANYQVLVMIFKICFANCLVIVERDLCELYSFHGVLTGFL
ncbi:hypothetical protein PO909_021554 [Leuciscus waleckii]